MTEEARTDSEPDDGTRRARLSARRGRHVRMLFSVLSAGVVALGVAVGAYALTREDNTAKAGTNNTAATTPFGDGRALPNIVGSGNAQPLRALDHAHPLRLWVGGDSLAGSFGPSLGDMVGATGIVKTSIDYKVSSGLWSDDIRNWYARATDQMKSFDPEVVVFIIGTNDTLAVNKVDANHDGTPDWQVTYREKVDRMMDLFVGSSHRTVLWLGAPTLGNGYNDEAAQLDEVMRAEAEKRSDDVTYVDTYKLFEDQNGEFSRRILDENGKEITARIADGVHFTEDGAQYLARAVYSVLNTRWHLAKQADTSQPIQWSFASGSGEIVPGYQSSSHSHAYKSRGVTHTSTPSTLEETATSVADPSPTTVATPPTIPVTTPATTPVTDPSPPTT